MKDKLTEAQEFIKEWGLDPSDFILKNVKYRMCGGEPDDNSIELSEYYDDMLARVVKAGMENNKLILEWEEGKLAGGSPLFMIDESNGVAIKCEPLDGLQLWIFARRKEGDKYYCRVIKKFTIPNGMLMQHNFNRYTNFNNTPHKQRIQEVKYINTLLGYMEKEK